MRTATSFIPPSQTARSSSPTSSVTTGYAATPHVPTTEGHSRPRETQTPTEITQSQTSLSTGSTEVHHMRPTVLGAVTGLNKWEGKIRAVEVDFFTAELYPIERDGLPITADFDLELLGSDAASAVPGDVFYLSVRTVGSAGMRPTRTESLRLRRLGRITQKDIQDTYTKADALMEHLEQLFD